jgi:antitoxin HigA-1
MRGQVIRIERLEPLDFSMTAPAETRGVTRPTLSALLNAWTSLSPDMALHIEKTFCPKMDTLPEEASEAQLADGLRQL